MPGRNAQVTRIFAILDLLDGSPAGLTVAEVFARTSARGHEASKRTIYRDLEALGAAGFPLFPDGEGDTARWKLERQTRITDYLVLSARELFALYLARESLTPLKNTIFYKDLSEAFTKIAGHLGTNGQRYFAKLSDEIAFEPSPKWGFGLEPLLVDTVRAAWTEGKVVEVLYRSVNAGGTERSRRLGAHFLYFAKGGIYLVAEDLEVNETKVFNMARMRSARMCDERYEGRIADAEKFFEASMGVYRSGAAEKVRLLFKPPITTHIQERQWHSSQETVLLESGNVRLSLEVALTPELLQWVLSYGAMVTVERPLALKRQVVAAAKETLGLYRKKKAA